MNQNLSLQALQKEHAIHALRAYFRDEYMMGDSDIAFEMWIKNTLEQ